MGNLTILDKNCHFLAYFEGKKINYSRTFHRYVGKSSAHAQQIDA